MQNIEPIVVNVIKQNEMSIKLYKHLTETNEIVKSTIKTFRKNDNKSRKPQNLVHKKTRS
jgi:hypothetical protein